MWGWEERNNMEEGAKVGGYGSHSRAWAGGAGSLPPARAAEWAAAHPRWSSAAAPPGSRSDAVLWSPAAPSYSGSPGTRWPDSLMSDGEGRGHWSQSCKACNLASSIPPSYSTEYPIAKLLWPCSRTQGDLAGSGVHPTSKSHSWDPKSQTCVR